MLEATTDFTRTRPGTEPREPVVCPGLPMLEDSELVRKAKDGDETGFDELVRRYQQRVYATAYRLVRNPEDARDVAQDVFVKVYRALPKFEERSKFYTWLYRIAVNQALSHLRRRKRQQVYAATDEQLDSEAVMNLPARNSPEADFQQTRLRQEIDKAVSVLPNRQRAVFVLRQYNGLSNNEIAQTLKCSVGAVKAHYFFAVHKLQKTLKSRA